MTDTSKGQLEHVRGLLEQQESEMTEVNSLFSLRAPVRVVLWASVKRGAVPIERHTALSLARGNRPFQSRKDPRSSEMEKEEAQCGTRCVGDPVVDAGRAPNGDL